MEEFHRVTPHEGEVVLIGPDRKGRPMQLVVVKKSYGSLVIHALRPPQAVTYAEVGLAR